MLVIRAVNARTVLRDFLYFMTLIKHGTRGCTIWPEQAQIDSLEKDRGVATCTTVVIFVQKTYMALV